MIIYIPCSLTWDHLLQESTRYGPLSVTGLKAAASCHLRVKQPCEPEGLGSALEDVRRLLYTVSACDRRPSSIPVYIHIYNTREKHTPCWAEFPPRWSIDSGNPRMLLVLVREFEPRRGEIFGLFAKIKKDQLLRAPNNSVGKHNSTRVDEGRKSSSLLAKKMQGTNRSG